MSRRNRAIHAARHQAKADLAGVPGKEFAQKLQTLTLETLAAPAPDKRMVVFNALADQLEHDNKRPFNLAFKLSDPPYRYTRDTLRAALHSVSRRLSEHEPSLTFKIEGDFAGPGDFASFVNAGLSGTVSDLISSVTAASRWPDAPPAATAGKAKP